MSASESLTLLAPDLGGFVCVYPNELHIWMLDDPEPSDLDRGWLLGVLAAYGVTHLDAPALDREFAVWTVKLKTK